MKRHVFSLGIVPVQEWIAESRRSRDLRAGSVLLSWLMAKVLAALEKHQEPAQVGDLEIVIPKKPDPDFFVRLGGSSFADALAEAYGIPNRASGFFRSIDPASVLGTLEAEIVREGWRGWKEKYLVAPTTNTDSEVFWKRLAPLRAEYQSAVGEVEDCPFQLIWAVQTVGESEELSDRAALTAIDRLYSEIKRSRRVAAWRAPAPVGKCTVCGKREAIGPKAGFAEWRDWHRTTDRMPWIERGWRLEKGERLCYVCLTRRMAAYAVQGQPFPSTGFVASAPWRSAVKRAGQQAAGALELLEKAAAKDEERDLGRALYLREEELQNRGATEILAARRALQSAIREHNRRRSPGSFRLPADPPSYLALLVFDGDDMGARLQADPGAVSGEIQQFSQQARTILDDADSGIFYLGGDEGLALVPAVNALATAARLRKELARASGGEATLSAGLLFFEQKRPLGTALREARRLLARAKTLDDKNALGVAVQTAAGTRWDLVDHWGPTWHRLVKAVEAVQDGSLSNAWAYDVESFLNGIDAATWRELAHDPRPVRLEVQRLLFRRLRVEGRQAERRTRSEVLWRELEGDSLWPIEGGQLPEPRPEQFHLVGFLARQLPVEAEATASPGQGPR